MGGEVYPAWCRPLEDILHHHGVDLSKGLTDEQVVEKREKYGFNELEKQKGKPLWLLVLEQFDDMLVKVLLAAAVVSLLLAYFEEGSREEGIRAYIEPAVILLILILNAIVGVWQESNAEAALEALKQMQSETASVLRNGKQVSNLPARELVPGDVVFLHVGDRVPADCRVASLNTATLRAEQASLTGEAMAARKGAEQVPEEECQLHDKECMLFASTAITNGGCTAIVNSTGMATEIGKIQAQIQEAAEEEEDTPLKKKLNAFGETLAQVIFVVCVLVWLINYHQYLSWKPLPEAAWLPDPRSLSLNVASCIYYFKIAVALAVAAIPEGLPAVITTCLALGTRKMAKRNSIVRKLPSVETLGCTTVICSDKTGTLTTNQMSCLQLLVPGNSALDLKTLEVEGTSYNPADGGVVGITTLSKNLEKIAEVCILCNDARLEWRDGKVAAVGGPTEAALVVLAEKLGVPEPALQQQIHSAHSASPPDVDPVYRYYTSRLKKLATLEFDRDRKSMSVLCAPVGTAPVPAGRVTRNSVKGQHGNVLFVKGASEVVLSRCSQVLLEDGRVAPLDRKARDKVLEQVDSMSESALRCLALAYKTDLGPLSSYTGESHEGHQLLMEPANYSEIESNMIWLGVVGLLDPPRPEVQDAIANCSLAGIRVMMITGDNKLTAEAISRKIGLFSEGESLKGKSFTGREFSVLTPDQQRLTLEGTGSRCFSRAEPKQKQDIIRLLKEMGQVTAMTGDGVNDAPALKLADIGIAMGISGTEVAKEACDMVLADDNFSSIVAAVEEGRAIYNNMKAFIRYMISSNIGEVASIFITAALGLPENLIPVQLLWVNLVTDGPPATALGFNPPDVDIMRKPPRAADEELITPWIFFRWMLVGIYVGCATVGVFVAWYLCDSFLGIPLAADGHTTVTWYQLSHWTDCPNWPHFQATPYTAGGRTITFATPCDYFASPGKAKASTLALSVLVAIEMFNALNALSEDNSLLQMPPWSNPWLLVAMALSFGLHFVILYVPPLADIFSIVPLNFNEWLLVILFAAPVILIDEALKFVGRHFVNPPTSQEQLRKLKSQ